jgi:hypothetical protein
MVAKASTPRRIAKVTNLDKFLSSSNYLVLLPARITVPGWGVGCVSILKAPIRGAHAHEDSNG